MKLIIQIPAFNETATLGQVLEALPRTALGVTEIEYVVVDDGSRDETAALARAHGAHVVRHRGNRGLARAFQTGMDACLRRGADIIVNTDADGQYPGAAIPALIAPIVRGEADLVIGDRQVQRSPHFSWPKKLLQALGSWVVRQASGTRVPDAPSGFRAYSREAALRLFVTAEFSYTIEQIIKAGNLRLAIAYVPIETAPPTRPSRLYHGLGAFVQRQGATILRTYAAYQPLRTFFWLGLPFFAAGVFLLARLMALFVLEGFSLAGHLQSLVLGVGALIMSFVMFQFGLLAERISDNRRLLEELLYRQRRMELEHRPDAGVNPAAPSASAEDADGAPPRVMR